MIKATDICNIIFALLRKFWESLIIRKEINFSAPCQRILENSVRACLTLGFCIHVPHGRYGLHHTYSYRKYWTMVFVSARKKKTSNTFKKYSTSMYNIQYHRNENLWESALVWGDISFTKRSFCHRKNTPLSGIFASCHKQLTVCGRNHSCMGVESSECRPPCCGLILSINIPFCSIMKCEFNKVDSN